MNAEVSDPAYGLYYFQNYSNRFSPKIVVYGLCHNDLLQSYWFISYFKIFSFVGDKLVPGPGSGTDISVFHQTDFWDKVKDITYPVPGTYFHDQNIGKRQSFIENLSKFRALIYLKQLFFSKEKEDSIFDKRVPEVIRMELDDRKKRLIDGYMNLGFLYKKRIPFVDRMRRVYFKSLRIMASRAK